MSTERKDGIVRFHCNGPACRKNFEGDVGEDFRAVWAGAKSYGWVSSSVTVGNLTEWKHFCPECKKALGD